VLFRQKSRAMKRYRFYGKSDSNKESYSTVHASSRIEAVEYFAKVKELSVEKFLKIYDVVEVE